MISDDVLVARRLAMVHEVALAAVHVGQAEVKGAAPVVRGAVVGAHLGGQVLLVNDISD